MNLAGAESFNGEGGLVAPKACTERVGRDRNRRRRMRTPTYELQSRLTQSSRVCTVCGVCVYICIAVSWVLLVCLLCLERPREKDARLSVPLPPPVPLQDHKCANSADQFWPRGPLGVSGSVGRFYRRVSIMPARLSSSSFFVIFESGFAM